MAIQIQFRRGLASEWSTVNPILAEGEMGIESDTDLFKLGNGILNWNDLPYGGLQGPQGNIGPQGPVGDGNIAVDNVLYVSKSGNDSNDGLNLSSSKLTIKAALEIATSGTTIFVKSGDYTENNPLLVPPRVSVVGDNLRTVTVRPANDRQDLFWVNNGCYLEQMTFKDHKAPAAAVAFPPDGSAGVIFTSPYVQNCTSMTTTGTGMRVDGDHVSGLKSMVVDAYTQFNQGGIGIHMLNRGNTQLVSVFTICCNIGFLCETGGFCSITNANSSFGNFALLSDGVSNPLYSGKTKGINSGRTFTIDNLIVRPNVGDAVKFVGDEEYYTVASSTAFTAGGTEIVYPNFTQEAAGLRNARSTLLDGKSKLQILTIEFLNLTYPDLNFNQFKCSRDVGLIIDAVADDLVLNTNYKSRLAGISYYRASASKVISEQLTETIAAIEFVKAKALDLLAVNYQPTDVEYLRAEENFDTVLDGLNDISNVLVFNNPTGVASGIADSAIILQANKNFLIEEGIAFIAENFPSLTYNESKCREDIAFIVDAVTYDVLYGGNSQTADAADEYYSAGTLQIDVSEKQATIDTFNYIKTVASACVTNTTVTALNDGVAQNTSITTTATETEALLVEGLFEIVSNIIENAYKSIVTLEESAPEVADDTTVTFHQYSLITASGHTFEFVGSGTNINTALPYLGGVPITENQAVENNGGKIFFTGTDQRGDFRIGQDFVINQNTGTISGRTFTRSLFAVMTPYILAIGD
jgi:hypothetical protein